MDITVCDKKIKYGRNKNENDILYTSADENDIWFHIHNEPSAHLWLKSTIYTKQELYTIALQLKMRSKYKKQNHIEVIYTQKKNLQKTNTIGKLSIIGKYNKIKV